MSSIMIAILVLIGVVVLLLVAVYNRLVVLKQRVNEAFSEIDVQLKKRADLIPNLVETVKGYATHEKSVLENVTKARAMLQDAGSDQSKMIEANNAITGALKSLFAVVENYPQLKANENFKMLQEELSGIESKIAYARQFYNECVMAYNQYQQVFPAVMFAAMFGHSAKGYFEAEDIDRKKPEVKF